MVVAAVTANVMGFGLGAAHFLAVDLDRNSRIDAGAGALQLIVVHQEIIPALLYLDGAAQRIVAVKGSIDNRVDIPNNGRFIGRVPVAWIKGISHRRGQAEKDTGGAVE